MAQDKAAEIFNFNAPRAAAANDGETTGDFLASARAAAGVSIEEASDATKVKVAHLQAIEAMRADLLPPLPYTIGFVKAYARFLQLDAETVAKRFREELGSPTSGAFSSIAAESNLSATGGEGIRVVSAFAVIAILAFAIWVMFQVTGGGRDASVNAARQDEPRVRLGDTPVTAPTPRPSVTASPVQAQAEETSAETAVINEPPDRLTVQEEEVALADGAPEAISEEPATGEIEQAVQSAATGDEQINNAPLRSEPEPVPPEQTRSLQSAETARPLPRRTQPVPEREAPAEPVVIESRLLRSFAPAYPERCARRAAPVESVTIRFDITPAGRPTAARVSSTTNSCFNQEAIDTLLRWRFNPRTISNAAVIDAGKTATINFRK
ncbi:TonB family protein [Hyphococcus flavus]|uniref:TonB family protein n=1 Tax=Hyphococcus flavus TaxID=1866326 RepID=A0AAE9ZLN9_9PROT|nr:TonB family protein [Hyphococcus flavus]WDI33015.1 TonB family protein [Hyphococcus flavus]